MQTSGDVERATPPDANIRIRGIATWKPATQLEPAKKQHAFRCKDGKCLVIYALHVNESSEPFLQGRCAISCWFIQCWQIDHVRQSRCASAFALTDTAMVTNDQLCISAMKFSGLKLGFWVSASVPSNFPFNRFFPGVRIHSRMEIKAVVVNLRAVWKTCASWMLLKKLQPVAWGISQRTCTLFTCGIFHWCK